MGGVRNYPTVLCAVAVVALGALPAVMAAPKTDVASTAWQLEFTFLDPQRITVDVPGRGSTTFWYVVYRVTNNTGKDVQFFPSFRLVTDTLKVVEGGAGATKEVFEAIAELHRPQFPFLAHPMQVTGPLLQGEENSRASAAVFLPFDPEASAFTIYVSGLSGEITRVPNPVYDSTKPETEENPRAFVLRRTLAVGYAMPGDAETSPYMTPIRRDRTWVMR